MCKHAIRSLSILLLAALAAATAEAGPASKPASSGSAPKSPIPPAAPAVSETLVRSGPNHTKSQPWSLNEKYFGCSLDAGASARALEFRGSKSKQLEEAEDFMRAYVKVDGRALSAKGRLLEMEAKARASRYYGLANVKHKPMAASSSDTLLSVRLVDRAIVNEFGPSLATYGKEFDVPVLGGSADIGIAGFEVRVVAGLLVRAKLGLSAKAWLTGPAGRSHGAAFEGAFIPYVYGGVECSVRALGVFEVSFEGALELMKAGIRSGIEATEGKLVGYVRADIMALKATFKLVLKVKVPVDVDVDLELDFWNSDIDVEWEWKTLGSLELLNRPIGAKTYDLLTF